MFLASWVNVKFRKRKFNRCGWITSRCASPLFSEPEVITEGCGQYSGRTCKLKPALEEHQREEENLPGRHHRLPSLAFISPRARHHVHLATFWGTICVPLPSQPSVTPSTSSPVFCARKVSLKSVWPYGSVMCANAQSRWWMSDGLECEASLLPRQSALASCFIVDRAHTKARYQTMIQANDLCDPSYLSPASWARRLLAMVGRLQWRIGCRIDSKTFRKSDLRPPSCARHSSSGLPGIFFRLDCSRISIDKYKAALWILVVEDTFNNS